MKFTLSPHYHRTLMIGYNYREIIENCRCYADGTINGASGSRPGWRRDRSQRPGVP